MFGSLRKSMLLVVHEGSYKMDIATRWNAVKRQRQDSDLSQCGTVKTIGVNQIRFHYCILNLDDALIALRKMIR